VKIWVVLEVFLKEKKRRRKKGRIHLGAALLLFLLHQKLLVRVRKTSNNLIIKFPHQEDGLRWGFCEEFEGKND